MGGQCEPWVVMDRGCDGERFDYHINVSAAGQWIKLYGVRMHLVVNGKRVNVFGRMHRMDGANISRRVHTAAIRWVILPHTY